MSKRRFPTDLETAQSLNKVQREELARLRGEAAQKDSVIKALADALEEAEKAMGNSPAFNPWDLGPAPVLTKARSALRLAGRL